MDLQKEDGGGHSETKEARTPPGTVQPTATDEESGSSGKVAQKTENVPRRYIAIQRSASPAPPPALLEKPGIPAAPEAGKATTTTETAVVLEHATAIGTPPTPTRKKRKSGSAASHKTKGLGAPPTVSAKDPPPSGGAPSPAAGSKGEAPARLAASGSVVSPLPSNISSPVPQPESPSIAKTAAGVQTGGANYRIGPEDILQIDVWGNEELSGKYTVRPDGKISMPLIQDVHADGLTADELSGRIHDKLLPFLKDPTVSVIVSEINAPKFFLIGYVAKPGKYPLRGDITVLQAISLGGGFTEFASPGKIRLVRNAGGKPDIREINYYRIIETGGEGNVILKPGDTLVVP